VRAALGVGPEDHPCLAGRVGQETPLGEIAGQGLLTAHVQALRDRRQRDDRVPVVGGGVHDGIEVLHLERLAPVREQLARLVPVLFVDLVLGGLGPPAVDVTYRHDPHLRQVEESAEVGVVGLSAATDHRHVDLAGRGVLAEHGGGNDQGNRRGSTATRRTPSHPILEPPSGGPVAAGPKSKYLSRINPISEDGLQGPTKATA